MSGKMSERSAVAGANEVEEFRSRFYALKIADERSIRALTSLAKDNAGYAASIVNIVESRLRSAAPDTILPIVYLMDSLLKNVGNDYITLFCKNLIKVLASALPRLDNNDRIKLFQVRSTWKTVIPKVVLFHLDVKMNAIDPMWLVISRVHINPVFMGASPNSDARAGASYKTYDTDDREEFLQREMLRVQKELETATRFLQERESKNVVVSIENPMPKSPTSYSSELSEMAGLPENLLNLRNSSPALSRKPGSSIYSENASAEFEISAHSRISDTPSFQNWSKALKNPYNSSPESTRRVITPPQPSKFLPSNRTMHEIGSPIPTGSSMIQEATLPQQQLPDGTSPNVSAKEVCSPRNLKSLSKAPSPTKTSKKSRTECFNMYSKPLTGDTEQQVTFSDVESYLNSGKDLDFRPLTAVNLEPKNCQYINENIGNLDRLFGNSDSDLIALLPQFPIRPKEQPASANFVVTEESKSKASDADPKACDVENILISAYKKSADKNSGPRLSGKSLNEREIPAQDEGNQRWSKHQAAESLLVPACGYADPVNPAHVTDINVIGEHLIQHSNLHSAGMDSQIMTPTQPVSVHPSRETAITSYKTEPWMMPSSAVAPQVVWPNMSPVPNPFMSWESCSTFRPRGHCEGTAVSRDWPYKVPRPDPAVIELVNCDPMATVKINRVFREIRFYDDIAVFFPKWDNPREIRFQNGSRLLVINERQRYLLHFNQPCITIRVGSTECEVRLGSPSRELYVNGIFYRLEFGGPPVLVKIGKSLYQCNLLGKPPSITFGKSRKDLVLGKIPVTINGTDIRRIYLDSKPQRFDIRGAPFILQFANGFQSILINGVPMEVSFGSGTRPVGVFFRGMRNFFSFASLPEGLIPGNVTIRGMLTGILHLKEVKSSLPHPPPFWPVNVPPPMVNQFNISLATFGQVNPDQPDFSHPPPFLPMSASPHTLNQFNIPRRPVSAPYAGSAGTSAMKPNADKSSHPHANFVASPRFSSLHPGFSAGSLSAVQPESPRFTLLPSFFQTSNTPPGATSGCSETGKQIMKHTNRIDVKALFKKLQDVGMVPSNTANKAAGETSSHLVVPVSFTNLVSLRTTRQPGLINKLYSGSICGICSLRFQASETKHYCNHLDWHFRENQRVKKGEYRAMYMRVADWKEFVSCEREEDRPSSFFHIQERLAQSNRNIPQVTCSAPVGDRGQNVHCEVCGDAFEQFYCEEEEEWHLKEAVEVNGKVYHVICHSDMLKSGTKSSPVVETVEQSNDNNSTPNVVVCIDVSSNDDDDDMVEVPVAEEVLETLELSDEDNDTVIQVKRPCGTEGFSYDLSRVKWERFDAGGLDHKKQLILQGGEDGLQSFESPNLLSTGRLEYTPSMEKSNGVTSSIPSEDDGSSSISEGAACGPTGGTDSCSSTNEASTSTSEASSSNNKGSTSSSASSGTGGISTSSSASNSLEDKSTSNIPSESSPSSQALNGPELPPPMQIKPKIAESELLSLPPVSKGVACSALCSLM